MPWKHSIGPVTREGKAASAANRAGYFGRQDEELRQAQQEHRAAREKVLKLMTGKRRSFVAGEG
jgi:hypothetical protein